MLPLSVSIICRNNEATIGRTLDSVAGLAAEVVAVDSGSTDGTVALLEKHGARVIRTEWKGHIATKQLALEACTQPWVLSLDSDESAEPDLRAALEAKLAGAPAAAGFEINRKVFYRARPLNFAWQPEYRLRLVRREGARWTGLDPHDRLEVAGPVERLAGTIRHDTIPTFAEFLGRQAVHSRTIAASLHAQGQRGSLLKVLTSPPGAFLKQLVLKQAWRDGWPGWLAAGCTGAASLMKHIDLVELSRSGGDAGAARR
jgi:glycosyltransferase involved in cell wall biosynthesis